ncbi:carboxylating nicotinate-nucleotide diphosphorylase [Thiotrichales bacterium 19S3-7]|nr:carboxylating nicotinate-nucleotide diphosphorylase [Thiotrichales bacterium 19S3-7]MCF6800890.1 carboxylating nicotinate-nucleotide diphosphorylase [Thiotrichales bacterium 19S3-11]
MHEVQNKLHLNIKQIDKINQEIIQKMVADALEEDIQTGDITAELVKETTQARAQVITREPMVVCAMAWVEEVFRQINPQIKLLNYVSDGDKVAEGTILFEVDGNAKDILTAERTAMNFLQMLSGVATKTNLFVEKIAHTNAQILDTRKTIPGFRYAQKYAVNCGGGMNHRIGLFDAFLIKENHIIACGSIAKAVEKARKVAPEKAIEVEVENFDELAEAIKAKADVIMLDNFNLLEMQQAVSFTNAQALLEASGNVDLQRVVGIAESGIDFISIGGITKHIQAVDLSMRFI